MVCSLKINMSIHKDKKRNTYYVKYLNKTKRGFASKKEAMDYEASLRTGAIKPKAKEIKYLFSFMADDFLASKKNEVAYASYVLYKQIIRENIKPKFLEKNINDINEKDCRDFKDYVCKTKYSTKRKNRILHLFKNIFRHANEYYGLSNDPTYVIKTINTVYEERIKWKSKALNIWSNEEFNLFIACVKNEKYKPIFITLFYTGLRLGEALALNWNDLKDNCLSITKSNSKVCETGNYMIKYPKNVSSIRDVSINKSLNDYLLSIKEKEKKKDNYSDTWFIFGGEKPLSRTSIERVKNAAVKMSGVKKIRLHDFRHSHASILIGEGVDIVAVSKRLGHSNVSMTLKVYTHLLDKNDDKLVDFVEKSSHDLLTAIKS